MRVRKFCSVGIVALASVFVGGGAVHAATYCGSLAGLEVVIGEVRTNLSTGYANAYGDGGDELSIATERTVGYLPSGDVDFVAAAYIEDNSTTDCATLTISYQLFQDISAPINCAGSTSNVATSSWSVDTCAFGGGSNDLFYSAKTIGHYTLGGAPQALTSDLRAKKGATTQSTDVDGCLVYKSTSSC